MLNEADTVEVTFDDGNVFPSFTVRVITSEEPEELHSKESINCHCTEQSLIGNDEVQEWKVEMDDSFSEPRGP